MRVLTWNLWGIGPNPEGRARRILDELRTVDADLMGFQEVVLDDDGSTFLDDYAAEIGGSIVYGPAPDGFDSPMRNAIVSRLPVVDSATQHLSSGRDVRYRSVVMVDVEVLDGTMRFYTTHLEHRFHHSALRQQQLSEVLAFVQSHESNDAAHAPVLTGDLNALPHSDEIRRLTGAAPPLLDSGSPHVFIDAWSVAGPDPGYTWSTENSLLVDPQWPNRRLDYVMVGYPIPKGHGRPRTAKLIGTSEPGSDHFGVVVDLR